MRNDRKAQRDALNVQTGFTKAQVNPGYITPICSHDISYSILNFFKDCAFPADCFIHLLTLSM